MGMACMIGIISGDMDSEWDIFALCALIGLPLGESGLVCCLRPLLACTLSTHVSCLPVRTQRMHGLCWSQRAFAFLQLEHARTTRTLLLAASSLPDAALPLSSPVLREASDVGSVDCQSVAVRDGEEDAVREGDDCGEDAMLDASVLATGGDGDGWLLAATGELPAVDVEDDEEAEKVNDEAEEEAEVGEAAVDAARGSGGSELAGSSPGSVCGCCIVQSTASGEV